MESPNCRDIFFFEVIDFSHTHVDGGDGAWRNGFAVNATLAIGQSRCG